MPGRASAARLKPRHEYRLAYSDTLHLLERGADPHRAARDGMTLAKMLMAHREKFTQEKFALPREFTALWDWAQSHGIVPQPE